MLVRFSLSYKRLISELGNSKGENAMKKVGVIVLAMSVVGICAIQARSQINWMPSVSKKTIEDGLIQWETRYRALYKSQVDGKKFMESVAKGTYQLVKWKEFKHMTQLFNERLKRCLSARTAEDTYPADGTRKNRENDIRSVKYHAETKNPISPICVARVKMADGTIRMIRLDGTHRIAAAMIRRSDVKIFFIDL